MKNLFWAFFLMGSFSVFANCEARIDTSTMGSGNSALSKARELAEKSLIEKGFEITHDLDSEYTLKIGVFSQKRTWDHEPYSIGRVQLIKNYFSRYYISVETGKNIFEQMGKGSAAKAIRRFKRALDTLPRCEDF